MVGLKITLFVSQLVCHMKRFERSTHRNLPPIFVKLATKVIECPGRCGYLSFWRKSERPVSAKPEVELIFYTIGVMQNIALMSNISKTVIDTKMGLKEAEYETALGC